MLGISLLLCCFISLKTAAQDLATGSRISGSNAKKMLDHHNKVRNEVGVAPLKWSAALASYAQKWADYLANSCQCRLEHRRGNQREGKKYGENIFWGSSAEAYNALSASESWYEEAKAYKYGRLDTDNWGRSGHYTQMIWSGTYSMGAGAAFCPSGGIIVVANYDPPGNYLGEYPY